MERRVDISRVRDSTAAGARTFVKDVLARTKKAKDFLANLGFQTSLEFQKAIEKARFNDWRRRYGRSSWNPHSGAQQLSRTQRVGSPAWHGWKNANR